MIRYNKIMQFLWLSIGIILVIVVSYLCIKDGFNKWGMYYILAGLCFLAYFVKRWMIRRMEKHSAWMQEQQNNK